MKVKSLKNQFMADIDTSLQISFHNSVPKCVKQFFIEVNKIGYNSEPNYMLLKQILLNNTFEVKKENNKYYTNCDKVSYEQPIERCNEFETIEMIETRKMIERKKLEKLLKKNKKKMNN